MEELKIKAHSPEETICFAKKLGKRLRGGECIELQSDVGGGKTTFVRGLAEGAGSKDHVSSPTFTISKLYQTKEFDIVHFDFYRLQEADLIAHEIEEAVHDSKTVIVVEWSEIVQHVLPKKRVDVHIRAIDNQTREITVRVDRSFAYLIDQIV
ncbi:MAG: tRNA (adenosine(37)-N6)-threonylcarbamoyltransferase complex ATPase subunit type 1 TsaE [Patescibacteria group bacterium]|nr:MAG: tRNA (adenosine(37)-N6)-threonylcarbamoyltransferase complex ATPase subunit type 1 TsaE [Patescibacteria group bacterium]